jgi:single-stranded-DNA-specific exonuclease
MTDARIVTRAYSPAAFASLQSGGLHPVLARVLAGRGIDDCRRLDTGLASLLPVDSLARCNAAADLLADAIAQRRRMLVIADYDADGATACALAVSVLRAMGGEVSYLVPNRFEYGYGLTPEIVDLAARQSPDWLITVDNGIASVDGVARANSLGMRVLVTDHHLPGPTLPDAACIVNPNQQASGRRRRDVLRAARAARHAALSRLVRQSRRTEPRGCAGSGCARHRGRCRPP